jgi:hypothetical protein
LSFVSQPDFALAIMQSLLTSPVTLAKEDVVAISIELADLLIAALTKPARR